MDNMLFRDPAAAGVINPRRACAARVTVVTLSVCLSVCSINISPVACPGVKVNISIFITCVNLLIKLFVLCEILSLSRYDNFKFAY